MGERVGTIAGTDAGPKGERWTFPERSSDQELVDELQNKLAGMIGRAEAVRGLVDGAALEQVEAIVRAAWDASRLAAVIASGAAVARRAERTRPT